MEKLKKVIDLIKALKDKRFTGHLIIHFSRGSIGKMEKFEEIMKK